MDGSAGTPATEAPSLPGRNVTSPTTSATAMIEVIATASTRGWGHHGLGGCVAGSSYGAPTSVWLANRLSWSRTVAASGRVAGSSSSSRDSSGRNGPAAVGGLMMPTRTMLSSSRALSAVPKGGWPSIAAYSVEPSENTSEAGLGLPVLATSGAR